MAEPKRPYVDVDSTDDWMDKPLPKYDGKTMEQIDAERAEAGLPPAPVTEILPPPRRL